MGGLVSNSSDLEAKMNECTADIQRRLLLAQAGAVNDRTSGFVVSPIGGGLAGIANSTATLAALKPAKQFLDIAGWLTDGAMGRIAWPEGSKEINPQGAFNAYLVAASAARDAINQANRVSEAFPPLTALEEIGQRTDALVRNVSSAVASGGSQVASTIPWLAVGLVALVALYVLASVRRA